MNIKETGADYGILPDCRFTSEREIRLGQLVRSLAGRDKGQTYLVVGCDEDWILVADGRKRSIRNPKKKNSRHLQISHKVAADIMAKAGDQKITDEEIREQIRKLLSGDNRKEGK